MAYQNRDRGSDHYRPHYQRNDGPPPPPPGVFQFRGAAGGRDRNGADGRPDFTFRARTKISERPLLKPRDLSKEEQVLSTNYADGEKFRNLNELTDSDEAEMENSDEDEDQKPSAKRARLDDTQPAKPLWSNPDVYTSLPAPNETTGKKLDFIKLIRKARNNGHLQADIDANHEDFISFDDTDPADAAPSDAPKGPRIRNTDRTLGKRKRGEDTGSKLVSKRGRYFYQDGMVLDEWRPNDNTPSAPWLQAHLSDSVGIALHKEILDFYEWVRPRDYESDVRQGVIDRVSATLNRLEPGNLKAFGSYAAGLFLPTGDMDLVYLPKGFDPRKRFQDNIARNRFRRFGDYLRKSGIVQTDSLVMIPGAKVPLIKFVERMSGLKVDLSFNNDTGIVAIQTFEHWKKQYPAMPILVAVVKQFLMIRGLNDVSVGGLGGFSIICLVTSFLQHMPLQGSTPNLGEMLLEFFNLYGKLLDRNHVGIRMEPPGYVEKKAQARYMMNNDKPGRLMIIDPNRADNNISGGTREIETICTCFAQAHDTLLNRMLDYESHNVSSGDAFSFLEVLVGGDFRAYEEQRDILYGLHYGRTGPAPSVIPPPPPPIAHHPLPPPPPPPASNAGIRKNPTPASLDTNDHKIVSNDDSSSTGTGSKLGKNFRRANRMKKLRPDLASSIGDRITIAEALKLGGYNDKNKMASDLDRREAEMMKR